MRIPGTTNIELHTGHRVSSQEHQPPTRLIELLPLLFVFTLFVGYLVILLLYGRALIRFPFDYDQGEGFELYDAVRLAHGQNIYLDNAAFPFYSSNYPPVYRMMLAPLVWLFGSQLWVGRALTLICTLIIGVLVALAAWHQMRPEPAANLIDTPLFVRLIVAALAGLAFLAANYVYQIAPLARAHLPMVMFAFAGILCLDRAFARAEPDHRLAALGVALLIVAGFTKLQAIDALGAGFGFLLMRRPRWCLKALGASAAVTAIIVLALNLLTHGQFWLNVVLANVNEYDINQTWSTYGQWVRLEGALIVCSVLYVVWDIVRAVRARSISQVTVWSYYFAAGAAMGMLTGKWGAGPTYLIAAIAASCVCTVGLLWRVAQLSTSVRRYFSAPSVLALLCAGVFMVQAVLNVHLPTSGKVFGTLARVIGINGQSSYSPYPYYDSMGYTQLGHLLDAADTTNGWELVRIVREAHGPVWSEEAMLTLLAGKEVVTNPTQLYNLSKGNMLDTGSMIGMINTKAFGAVIFRAQFYPQDVLIAIGQNYHWVRAVRMNGFDYQVLYPNTAASQQDN